MKENNDLYENNPNEQNSPERDILAEVKNVSSSEDEKENSEEAKLNEEKQSNPMASFLNLVNQTKKENNENIIDTTTDKNKENQEEDSNSDDNSFDEKLLLECQKEDEENMKILQEKELAKKIKNIKYYNFKDYFLLFMLFMASSLNFNFLSLYYIVIGIVYLLLSENLNDKSKKIKYLIEIFTLGYASYTLIFKLVIVILDMEEFSHVQENKEIYINLGIAYLIDKDSLYYLFISFLTEILMIISSGYGIYVSFRCRILKSEDINFRKMKSITIRKLILILYIFIILFSVFNISYVTLLYLILIQLSLLLCSLKVNEEKIKKIFKFFAYLILFLISIQLLSINFFNIQIFQKDYLLQYEVVSNVTESNVTKRYTLLTQIGISHLYLNNNNTDENKFDNVIQYLKDYQGYLFGVLSMISLAFILGELNKGPNIMSEEELKVDRMKKKIEKNKELNKNHYILNGIDEINRVVSIFWIYYFRNFFSIGIFIVIFFSFYFIDRKKNRFLILYLLLPMLFLTLVFSHISNIDGLFENLGSKKEQLKRFAIEKYDYASFKYLSGHAYYILLMFLINSLYYFPKVKEVLKNKNTILSQKKDESQENSQIDNGQKEANTDAILPVQGSTKTLDIACSIPKADTVTDLLYEDVDEEKNNTNLDKNSDSDSDNENNDKEKVEINDNNENEENIDEFNFRFKDLIAKYFFINIDKLILVVMYLVSVPIINILHCVLVFIFIMQIVLPKKMHYFYKIIISIYQLLYLVEFVIDLLKIYYYEKFNSNKEILELFIVFGNESSNDIEIFIYGVVYCFCFQYRAYKNKYIASLLENKKISLRNYIKNFFAEKKDKKNKKKIRPNKDSGENIIYYIVCIINDFMEHVYIWALVIGFLFFSCYFEMNCIFWIKLILFFISLYYYIVSIQTPSHNRIVNNKENINITLYRVMNKIIIFYCCTNTFLVFLYQLLYKDYFKIQNIIDIKQSQNKFLINLPTIGFTLYEQENLYYNFLPYFMTCFIFNLYKRKTKKILKLINNFLIIRKQTNSRQVKLLKEKKKIEEEKMKKIKEEQNEFIQDKLYADKYNENEKEIYNKSRQLLKANIILIFTKCYWLFLYLFVGIVYSYFEISLSILIYIIIFGFFFIKMFHRIIIKLRNYIKMKSYYISKVVRYSIIENPKHYQINHRHRIMTYRCILIYTFLYFILLYLYGIFDLFQHGCKNSVFKGCVGSNSSLITKDSESIIEAFSFVFGIYINTQEKNIIDIWWIHLIVSCVLISDIYSQKLEENYRKKYDELRIELQKITNENNVLEKYSRIIDYNILIKIGLTVAGIDLTPVKEMW